VTGLTGLGPRDFIPLAIAIFVDFCILLVSMNRPFHAFRAFYGGVEEARTREMGEFMRMFREVFPDNIGSYLTPEQILAPIHDVVFDHRGNYYAAVPIYSKELSGGKGNKASYIANVMFALETHGFVKLVSRETLAENATVRESPGRMSRMVVKQTWRDLSSFAREQLRARGSEFQSAEDFRIYRFAKGKWPEIAMRAVISAYQSETRSRNPLQELRLRPEGVVPQVKSFEDRDELEGSRNVKQLPDRRTQNSDDSSPSSNDGQQQETSARDVVSHDTGTERSDKVESNQSQLDPEGINQDVQTSYKRQDQCSDIKLNNKREAREPNGGPGPKSDT
jgi:hypothetical protein